MLLFGGTCCSEYEERTVDLPTGWRPGPDCSRSSNEKKSDMKRQIVIGGRHKAGAYSGTCLHHCTVVSG